MAAELLNCSVRQGEKGMVKGCLLEVRQMLLMAPGSRNGVFANLGLQLGLSPDAKRYTQDSHHRSGSSAPLPPSSLYSSSPAAEAGCTGGNTAHSQFKSRRQLLDGLLIGPDTHRDLQACRKDGVWRALQVDTAECCLGTREGTKGTSAEP